jgi:hypothetical protein
VLVVEKGMNLLQNTLYYGFSDCLPSEQETVNPSKLKFLLQLNLINSGLEGYRSNEASLYTIINETSGHTSQETPYISATKSNKVLQFKEDFPVRCDNYKKDVNANRKAISPRQIPPPLENN